MNNEKPRVGRRRSPHLPAEYPKMLYHSMTGQMRRVISAYEEQSLGPEWGAAQMDVKFRNVPPPILTEPARLPVFTIAPPGEDDEH